MNQQTKYKKKAIPTNSQRDLALRRGCLPGEHTEANCYYCGKKGRIHWHTLYGGKPSAWVTFYNLEMDHVNPEFNGGSGSSENLVLACRRCNRSKGTKPIPNQSLQSTTMLVTEPAAQALRQARSRLI